MTSAARWLLGLAAVLLLATAAFHATGFGVVAGELDRSGIAPAWAGALKGLWLIFSVHLALVAAILAAGALRTTAMSRGVMALLGLIPAIDAVALFRLVGIFVGDITLTLAALCVFIAAGPERRGHQNVTGPLPKGSRRAYIMMWGFGREGDGGAMDGFRRFEHEEWERVANRYESAAIP